MKFAWYLAKSEITSSSHAAALHRARIDIERMLEQRQKQAAAGRADTSHLDSAHLDHAFRHHIDRYGDDGVIRMGLLLAASGKGHVQDSDIRLINRLPFTVNLPTRSLGEIGTHIIPDPSMSRKFFADFIKILSHQARADGYRTLMKTKNNDRYSFRAKNKVLEQQQVDQFRQARRQALMNLKNAKNTTTVSDDMMENLNKQRDDLIKELAQRLNLPEIKIKERAMALEFVPEFLPNGDRNPRWDPNYKKIAELDRESRQHWVHKTRVENDIKKHKEDIRKIDNELRRHRWASLARARYGDKTISPRSKTGKQILEYIKYNDEQAQQLRQEFYGKYPNLQKYEKYFSFLYNRIIRKTYNDPFLRGIIQTGRDPKTAQLLQHIIQDQTISTALDAAQDFSKLPKDIRDKFAERAMQNLPTWPAKGIQLQPDGTWTIEPEHYEKRTPTWLDHWGLEKTATGDLLRIIQDPNGEILHFSPSQGEYKTVDPNFFKRIKNGGLYGAYQQTKPGYTEDGHVSNWANQFAPNPKNFAGYRRLFHGIGKKIFSFFDPRRFLVRNQHFGVGIYSSTSPLTPRSIRRDNPFMATFFIPKKAKILHHDKDYIHTELPNQVSKYFDDLAQYMNAPELVGKFKETLNELQQNDNLGPGTAFSHWRGGYYKTNAADNRHNDEQTDQRGWRISERAKRYIGHRSYSARRANHPNLSPMGLPGHLLFRAIRLTFEKFGADSNHEDLSNVSNKFFALNDGAYQEATPYRPSVYHASMLLSSLGYRGYKHHDFESNDTIRSIGPWNALTTQSKDQIAQKVYAMLNQKRRHLDPNDPQYTSIGNRIQEFDQGTQPTDSEIQEAFHGGKLLTENEADRVKSVCLFPSALADMPPIRWRARQWLGPSRVPSDPTSPVPSIATSSQELHETPIISRSDAPIVPLGPLGLTKLPPTRVTRGTRGRFESVIPAEAIRQMRLPKTVPARILRRLESTVAPPIGTRIYPTETS